VNRTTIVWGDFTYGQLEEAGFVSLDTNESTGECYVRIPYYTIQYYIDELPRFPAPYLLSNASMTLDWRSNEFQDLYVFLTRLSLLKMLGRDTVRLSELIPERLITEDLNLIMPDVEIDYCEVGQQLGKFNKEQIEKLFRLQAGLDEPNRNDEFEMKVAGKIGGLGCGNDPWGDGWLVFRLANKIKRAKTDQAGNMEEDNATAPKNDRGEYFVIIFQSKRIIEGADNTSTLQEVKIEADKIRVNVVVNNYIFVFVTDGEFDGQVTPTDVVVVSRKDHTDFYGSCLALRKACCTVSRTRTTRREGEKFKRKYGAK